MQQLPLNVQLFYSSGERNLQYSTLDYQTLLDEVRVGKTFANALDEFLEPRFLAIFRPSRQRSYWVWLWFLPVLIYGVVYLGSKLKMYLID